MVVDFVATIYSEFGDIPYIFRIVSWPYPVAVFAPVVGPEICTLRRGERIKYLFPGCGVNICVVESPQIVHASKTPYPHSAMNFCCMIWLMVRLAADGTTWEGPGMRRGLLLSWFCLPGYLRCIY